MRPQNDNYRRAYHFTSLKDDDDDEDEFQQVSGRNTHSVPASTMSVESPRMRTIIAMIGCWSHFARVPLATQRHLSRLRCQTACLNRTRNLANRNDRHVAEVRNSYLEETIDGYWERQMMPSIGRVAEGCGDGGRRERHYLNTFV